jgi:two-component system sensor histidine kinase UhpB
LLFAGSFAAQLISAVLWSQESDAPMVWFTGGVLLAALLGQERPYWLACVVGWVVGLLASLVVFPSSLINLAVVTLPLVALILAAAWVLRRVCPGRRIDDFGRLAAFFAIGGFALPLFSAIVIVALQQYLISGVASSLHSWMHVALASALGYVLLVPALISLSDPKSIIRKEGVPGWLVMVTATGALALLWLAWRLYGHAPLVRPLLLLLPLTMVIFAALRTQIPGTSVAILLFGVVAMQISLEGHGPFLGTDMATTTLSVQLWTLGMSLAGLFLAALVEQRRVTQRELLDSSGQIRELAGRLIVAQEQERARIARDLHDDINQRLALASIQLSAIRRKVDKESQEDISQLQHELIALSDDVRHLSHELHPSMLSHTGLTAALAELCHAQRQRNGPRVDLRVSPHVGQLSQDVALCLYRVTQEALSNAVRHAHAQRISVAVDMNVTHVELDVMDDGNGFELSGDHSGETAKGLGLLSMDERVRSLDGELSLMSTLGKGTQLCIRIPLRHPEVSVPG